MRAAGYSFDISLYLTQAGPVAAVLIAVSLLFMAVGIVYGVLHGLGILEVVVNILRKVPPIIFPLAGTLFAIYF